MVMTSGQVLDGVTIGVTGNRRRWTVSAWGSVRPWDAEGQPGVGSIDWNVAADDRWHTPADEPAIRQRRLQGAPVIETRVRIPEGDAIQRVWAVTDHHGVVLVEFENASPLPIAIAIHGDHIVTERPPASVPVEGIELPEDTIVLPIGHHSTVRVALGATTSVPDGSPALTVARGWTRIVEQASRLILPDPAIGESVTAARCELLLDGPVNVDDDPVGFLLDVGELVRCGDPAAHWLVEMAEPAEHLAASGRQRRHKRSAPEPLDVEAHDALIAVRRVAQSAGDARACSDIDRMLTKLPAPLPEAPAPLADLRRRRKAANSVGRYVRRIERRLVAAGDLLPGGIPTGWLGADFEVHGIPTASDAAVGFAVRWHGERPAVLWEQSGSTQRLTAGSVDSTWSTTELSGEALWAIPANASIARRPISISIEGLPGGSE